MWMWLWRQVKFCRCMNVPHVPWCGIRIKRFDESLTNSLLDESWYAPGQWIFYSEPLSQQCICQSSHWIYYTLDRHAKLERQLAWMTLRIRQRMDWHIAERGVFWKKAFSLAEIKWTDKFFEDPSQLKSLRKFLAANDGIRKIIVTTKSKRGKAIVDDNTFLFIPSALYAYWVSRYLFEEKVNQILLPERDA